MQKHINPHTKNTYTQKYTQTYTLDIYAQFRYTCIHKDPHTHMCTQTYILPYRDKDKFIYTYTNIYTQKYDRQTCIDTYT